jgi:hypothetical protein
VAAATDTLRIVVSGLIAQHPRLGGMTWHYLQYLLGLARLGHDVYYFEDSGQVPYDVSRGVSGIDAMVANCEANIRHLSEVLARFGFEHRWAYRCAPESRWFGLTDAKRAQVLRSADLLINVSGTLEQPTDYRGVRRMIYIDTDPVVTQVKYLSGPPEFAPRVDAHDAHFSFGEQFSALVPDTGHRWLPTRQPILLSEWTPSAQAREVFTTVMSWTSYRPLRYEGREFAQKDAEIQRFIDLPSMVGSVRLEVAMARTEHPKWQSSLGNLPPRIQTLMQTRRRWSPQELLEHTGWQVVDADQRCSDIDAYRDYVRTSRGEWSVAKNAYVAGRPGWFSERSACYLASGRPVIVQDTGFSSVLPVGEGLLAFDSVEQATEAIREVDGDYDRHSRASRALAAEYFDADKVLVDLLERALNA